MLKISNIESLLLGKGNVFFNTVQVFSTKNDVIPFIMVRFFAF